MILTVGIAARDRIREEWYLARLKSRSASDRVFAAQRLGELGSVRSVPALLEAARQADAWESAALRDALTAIGMPSAPGVLLATSEGPGPLWELSLGVLGNLFHNEFFHDGRIHRQCSLERQASQQAAFVRFLEAKLSIGMDDAKVLRAAADALQRIQSASP